MRIRLSDNFDCHKLIVFTFPAVAMMVFTSIYTMVDGFFVSNFVGKVPFAAVNLIYPLFPIAAAIGLMIGSGGNALVGICLGEGDREKANSYFSMFIYSMLGIGSIFGIVCFCFSEDLSRMLGAQGELLYYATLYADYLFLSTPFFILSFTLQGFFVTAEKPKLGFCITLLGGMLNIVLDPLFIIVFEMGLKGAAIATVLSQVISVTVALIYFSGKNDSLLSLLKNPEFDFKVLTRSCFNGMSEMVTNIAVSVVTIVYNFQLIKAYGDNGVAAFGVIMYLSFLFTAAFYGFATGSAPIFSYNFGARRKVMLKKILIRALKLVLIGGAVIVLVSEVFSDLLAQIFVGYDEELCYLTSHALKLYAVSFLFSGIAIFGSAFFTALNNGMVSAVISIFRTFIFEIGAIIVLPIMIGANGIWLAIVVAEISSLLLTWFCMKKCSVKYGLNS
ncbi:MATE family efflux transporter [Succinivibrio dextrinosolvens]|uniref:Multidrug export protein MepA n=1 Tax=Succinivibrio dextrinosolvens TaxID=83771 RepID=A0A662Z6R7_9GAMM|nr:MATE family efflux transporter [Succinivibrio dextrinosolvens]SFJ79914.1 putative efflux protein, MATE family [Succinivibrio dextrinosolvens]